jgi:hypothetical protein
MLGRSSVRSTVSSRKHALPDSGISQDQTQREESGVRVPHDPDAIWSGVRPEGQVPPQASKGRVPSSYESTNHPWRLAIAGLVIAVALVGGLILGITWYEGASSTPYPPVRDGGLYLVLDRAGVDADLTVAVQQLFKEKPRVYISVKLSDPKARYALVVQGAWAFSDAPNYYWNPRRSGRVATSPRPGHFTEAPTKNKGAISPPFLQSQDSPSIVVTGRTYQPPGLEEAIGDYIVGGEWDVAGELSQPVEVSGRGLSRGRLPWVHAKQAYLPVGISGVPGTWVNPRKATATLLVTKNSSFSRLETSDPPASRTGNGILWKSEEGTIWSPEWETSNPDAINSADQTIFLIGIFMGIWGSMVVSVGQYLLGSWTRGRRDMSSSTRGRRSKQQHGS